MATEPADLVAVQQKWPRSTRDRLRNMVGAKKMGATTLVAIEAWMDENAERMKEERRRKREPKGVLAPGVESRPSEATVAEVEKIASTVLPEPTPDVERQSSERADERPSPVAQPIADTPESVAEKMKNAMAIARMGEEMLTQSAEQRVRQTTSEPSPQPLDAEQRVSDRTSEEPVQPEASAEQRVQDRTSEPSPQPVDADAERMAGRTIVRTVTQSSAAESRVSPFGMTDVRAVFESRQCPVDGAPVLVRTQLVDGRRVLASMQCRRCEWNWEPLIQPKKLAQ